MADLQPVTRIPAPDTLVSTRLGDLVGFTGSCGSRAWLGIPYAAPPVGAWRWRAPRDAEPWSGTRQALLAGPPCPQRAQIGMPGASDPYAFFGSEDCLYLNIWAPPARHEPPGPAPLPVMFWIHGGGNLMGQGDTYDGGKLAATRNVVVVTVNYRFGLFGWCAHPALRAEAADDRERSGNFGLLDLIRALEWVRDNIAAFGGDPQNVTLFGESAGGWNIFALMASPLAAGLFHRAIIQSGGDVSVTFADGENFVDDRTPGEARSSGEILLHLLMDDGTVDGRDEAKARLASMDRAAIAAYLPAKEFRAFLRFYDRIAATDSPRHSPTGFPHLFRDGVVLPAEGIRAAVAGGRYNKVPVILGTTRDEYRLMLPVSGGTTFVRPLAGGMAVAIDDKERYSLAAEYLTRLWKADAVDEPAAALHGHQPGSVFTYRFDWDKLLPASWLDGIDLGACHGTDVPFVFGTLGLGPEFIQLGLFGPDAMDSYAALSDAMMSYWAEFARSGDPGRGQHGSLASWLPWGSTVHGETYTLMLLDCLYEGGPRMSSLYFTKPDIIRELARDTRFRSQEQRCRLLRDLTTIRLGWRFTAEDYTYFDQGRCARMLPL